MAIYANSLKTNAVFFLQTNAFSNKNATKVLEQQIMPCFFSALENPVLPRVHSVSQFPYGHLCASSLNENTKCFFFCKLILNANYYNANRFLSKDIMYELNTEKINMMISIATFAFVLSSGFSS